MNYKVGDKVRVKKNLVVGKVYGHFRFVDEMKKYCGETFAIEECCNRFDGHTFYRLKNALICEGVHWSFTDEMLEPVRQTYTLQELGLFTEKQEHYD